MQFVKYGMQVECRSPMGDTIGLKEYWALRDCSFLDHIGHLRHVIALLVTVLG